MTGGLGNTGGATGEEEVTGGAGETEPAGVEGAGANDGRGVGEAGAGGAGGAVVGSAEDAGGERIGLATGGGEGAPGEDSGAGVDAPELGENGHEAESPGPRPGPAVGRGVEKLGGGARDAGECILLVPVGGGGTCT
jgi:hypothetical protein